MKLLIFALSVILFFSACNNNGTNGIRMQNGQCEKQGNGNMTNESNWRIDTCGCLGYRSLETAQTLIDEFDLLDKNIDEFESVFGIPNEKGYHGKKIVLSYYLQSVCDSNNKLVENADRCWVDFIFVDNRLKEIPKYYKIE